MANKYLEIIIRNLRDRIQDPPLVLDSPYPYMDKRVIYEFFREISGLNTPPGGRLNLDESLEGGADIALDWRENLRPPVKMLYESMEEILKEMIPLAKDVTDIDKYAHRYARLEGVLSSTRFPDGNLNLEIVSGDLRGVLFYNPGSFGTLFRPLLASDRLTGLHLEVEAIVYIHAAVEKMIFYHQSYGDNREHSWAPLSPVVIKRNESDREGETVLIINSEGQTRQIQP